MSEEIEIEEIDQPDNSAEILLLKDEIYSLESRIKYPPELRIAGLAGAAAYSKIGFPGLALAPIAYSLVSRITFDNIDRSKILQHLEEKKKQLEILERGHNQVISGVMGSQDLKEHTYDKYEFTGPWDEFIGQPQKGFHAIVYGVPKGGKSIFSILWAKYLSENFGTTLYVASEEGYSMTLQKKIEDLEAVNPYLYFSDAKDKESIFEKISMADYDFVFIDSINHANLTPENLEELKDLYPNMSLITVQQSTKGGQARGSQEYAHNCDIIIKVIAGVAFQQGRFQAPSELLIFSPDEEEVKKSDSKGNENQMKMDF